MSIQAIAWVFDYSQATGTDRLVLLALANHANSETGECHPGYRRIAHEANCAPSTVTAAIRRLVELGEVEVSARGTGRATTKYHLPWLSTGGVSARSRPNTTEGVVRGADPVVRGNGPVVRGLDRADPLTVNRTAHDTAPPADAGGVVAPNQTTRRAHDDGPARAQLGRGLDAPPLWDLDDDGRARPRDTTPVPASGVAAADEGREAIAEARRRLLEGQSKNRHPSNGPAVT